MKYNRIVLVIISLLLISACDSSNVNRKTELPEEGSEGAKVFKKFCSACHAPPRPSSHKADEWLNIVDRMQTHRIKKAYNPMNDSEKNTLVLYLQKHSAK